jgi:filamentous hemagglutinin
MAKGAGTAARIAKGAHEAEEVAKAAKAAKEAEEAATLAREAKAAREAREAREAEEARDAAPGPGKPKKEVTVKGREHKVPCFHPFDKKKFMRMSKDEQKAYLKEMATQLKRQEDAINSLSATEYKAARDAFAAVNRNPAADAAQEGFRARLAADIRKSIGKSLLKKGLSTTQARSEAVTRTEAVMNKLAALHDPDMVAGGWMHPDPTGMGRRDVNSSIGASWNQNDRVAGMDREANRAIENGRGDQKMNVKLEPCRGKGIR